MPNTYMVNNTTLALADKITDRAELSKSLQVALTIKVDTWL
jgi:hypothetical protein